MLLVFQLGAAALAVGVTAWAAFKVRPLLAEKERLETVIENETRQLQKLVTEKDAAVADYSKLKKQLDGVRSELAGARGATPSLAEAIGAFHRGAYKTAVEKYNKALQLDPGNAYIYNLKSYSEFKLHDYPGAIATMSAALKLRPEYDWGYFDLARYQCANGATDDAVETLRSAVTVRGVAVRGIAPIFIEGDGEFRRLCASVLSRMSDVLQPRR